MRKRFLTTVVAVLGAFFAPPLASEVQAQTLPVAFQTTLQLPAYGASQNVSVTLTAGTTYYFTCNSNSATGYSTLYDSVLTLTGPGGASVSNDDWGSNSSLWNTQLLGPTPTNGYSSFFVYTPTVSGAFTLNVAAYNWGAGTPGASTVIVYGGSGSPTPIPAGSIPNVRLSPRPDVRDAQQLERWVASPARG